MPWWMAIIIALGALLIIVAAAATVVSSVLFVDYCWDASRRRVGSLHRRPGTDVFQGVRGLVLLALLWVAALLWLAVSIGVAVWLLVVGGAQLMATFGLSLLLAVAFRAAATSVLIVYIFYVGSLVIEASIDPDVDDESEYWYVHAMWGRLFAVGAHFLGILVGLSGMYLLTVVSKAIELQSEALVLSVIVGLTFMSASAKVREELREMRLAGWHPQQHYIYFAVALMPTGSAVGMALYLAWYLN
jgi:hypothetical protein